MYSPSIRTSRIFLFSLVAVLAVTAVACTSSPKSSSAPAWGYDGAIAPELWGSLDPEWAVCDSGMEQSPIDIPADAPTTGGIEIDYTASDARWVDTGYTLQADFEPGNTLTLDGEEFALVQFHFHAQSENTLAGEYAPMEVHFVHANAARELAVVGVMLEEGEHNPAYAALFDRVPAKPKSPVTVLGLDLENLLPESRTAYRFMGSLTTPPCSEGVHWNVLDEPVELSAEQIRAYTDLHPNNYRPVQPWNDREFMTGR
jgi:carbonic anhydrase